MVVNSFGFIMYHNYFDAENCIRCFYYLGYEAKFAKVSLVNTKDVCYHADKQLSCPTTSDSRTVPTLSTITSMSPIFPRL